MCSLQDYVVAHLPKQVQAYLPKDVSAWLTKLMTMQRQSTGAGSATGRAVSLVVLAACTEPGTGNTASSLKLSV